MSYNEADTRAKRIDPAIHKRGWTEDQIRGEETAGTIDIVDGIVANYTVAMTMLPIDAIKDRFVDLLVSKWTIAGG
jgi:hypothetical protein